MGAKILIGNLPPATTEQEILDELTERGWPQLQVTKVDAGDPDRLVFTLETDLDPQVARTLAARKINKGLFKGREMTVYVPLFWK
jgi:hypothetical protein